MLSEATRSTSPELGAQRASVKNREVAEMVSQITRSGAASTRDRARRRGIPRHHETEASAFTAAHREHAHGLRRSQRLSDGGAEDDDRAPERRRARRSMGGLNLRSSWPISDCRGERSGRHDQEHAPPPQQPLRGCGRARSRSRDKRPARLSRAQRRVPVTGRRRPGPLRRRIPSRWSSSGGRSTYRAIASKLRSAARPGARGGGAEQTDQTEQDSEVCRVAPRARAPGVRELQTAAAKSKIGRKIWPHQLREPPWARRWSDPMRFCSRAGQVAWLT